jgi:methionyl-tRNA formyltransferase
MTPPEMVPLRIIFMGSAELSCTSLDALARDPDFSVVTVVTQPDRPSGRALNLHASPVKQLALSRNIPILQPPRARDEGFIASLQAASPDLIAVAAYGQILPKAILELPRYGCLNVHTSLLPKYRGAAPIQSAILRGESETGVTIMKMDAGLDTGDILAQAATPIHPGDDASTLHDRLGILGAGLLVSTIKQVVAGKITPRPQPADGVSHAPKLHKEDGRLDWSQPARNLLNRVRAFTPWPGAFTQMGDKAKPALLKIWRAEVVDLAGSPGQIIEAGKSGLVVACCEQALRILELQREGGRRMNAADFLAGHHLQPGDKLG